MGMLQTWGQAFPQSPVIPGPGLRFGKSRAAGMRAVDQISVHFATLEISCLDLCPAGTDAQ